MGSADYYVYVYIDPRNLEEFYYGKGSGNRKSAHLDASGDNQKARRVAAIKAAGREPEVKVIAAGLTEAEALLVEKTLIWRLGRTLTNVSSGHYADRFRPQDTLHLSLPGFDFANDVYYVNVGECETRAWADCRKFGFLAAGGARKWSDPLCSLEPGDFVVAYLKGAGYVGVGKVIDSAVPVSRFLFEGRPVAIQKLTQPGLLKRAADPVTTEYLVRIEWVASVAGRDAKFKPRSGLFTTPLIRASLARQPKTLQFVEEAFGISWNQLLGRE